MSYASFNRVLEIFDALLKQASTMYIQQQPQSDGNSSGGGGGKKAFLKGLVKSFFWDSHLNIWREMNSRVLSRET